MEVRLHLHYSMSALMKLRYGIIWRNEWRVWAALDATMAETGC